MGGSLLFYILLFNIMYIITQMGIEWLLGSIPADMNQVHRQHSSL